MGVLTVTNLNQWPSGWPLWLKIRGTYLLRFGLFAKSTQQVRPWLQTVTLFTQSQDITGILIWYPAVEVSRFYLKDIFLHRLMLTWDTPPSTNPCCCSSPIRKLSKWLLASPAWSSKRWQKSVEFSVGFFFCLSFLLLFPLDLSHSLSFLHRFRHQEIRGTVPAEAPGRSIQEEKEERQELGAWGYLGHRFTQRGARRLRYWGVFNKFHNLPAVLENQK